MAVKSSGVGLFTIPTAPAAGTSATSGSANVYTTTYVQLISSTAAALYITAIQVNLASTSKPTYFNIQLATGGAGSETIIGQIQGSIPSTAGATGQQAGVVIPIWPPIAVAISTRIAFKAADSVGALAWLVSLQCINQSGVVGDTNVNEPANVIQVNGTAQTAGDIYSKVSGLTYTVASQVDVNVVDWKGSGAAAMTGDAYARIGAPAGASLSADIAAAKGDTAAIKVQTDKMTFTISGKMDANVYTWNGTAVATPDTAGYPKVTIKSGTGTGEVNLSSGNLAGSVASVVGAVGSVTGSVGSVTGAVGSVTGAVGSVSGAVGSVTGNVGGNVVGSVASVAGAVASVTGLTAADVGSIKSTLGTAGAGLTALGDTRIAHLDANVSSRQASGASSSTDPFVRASLNRIEAKVSKR